MRPRLHSLSGWGKSLNLSPTTAILGEIKPQAPPQVRLDPELLQAFLCQVHASKEAHLDTAFHIREPITPRSLRGLASRRLEGPGENQPSPNPA